MSNYSVEIAGVSLSELFQNTGRFLIPRYQRPYSWREKEWQDLADDLISHWKSQLEFQSDYAMGEIRLERPESSGGSYLVADGQQRIVTFAILLSAIMRVLKHELNQNQLDDRSYLFDDVPSPTGNETTPRISDQNDSVTGVLSLIFSSPPIDTVLMSPHARAYKWFVEKLRTDFGSDHEALIKFRFHVLQKLRFTRTISGPGTGQQAFARANHRGRKLDDADLVKFLLLNESNHGHDAQLVWENWREFTDLCRDARVPEVKALGLWAATDLAEDANPVRKADARDLIGAAAKSAKANNGVAQLTAQLIAFMMSYKRVSEGQNSGGEFSPSYHNVSHSPTLRKLKQLTYLAHVCRHMSLSDREIVAEAIENTIVVAAYAKAFPPDVEKLVNRVRSHWRGRGGSDEEDFQIGLGLLRQFRNEHAAKFAKAIRHNSESALPPKGAYTALAYVEAYLNSGNNSTPRGKIDFPGTLEHILPQTLTPEILESYGDVKEAAVDRYRIGNMALLAGPQNSVNSNKPFAEKVLTFSGSTFLSTQMIVKSFANQGTFLTQASSMLPPTGSWNRASLEIRGKGIHELLCKCLDIQLIEPGDYVFSPIENEHQIDNRIPQADDPGLMLQFLRIVNDGNESSSDVAVAASAESRQVSYYLTALAILGLVESDEGAWQPTEEGIELLSREDITVAMKQAIMDSPLMISWVALETSAQKDAFLANHDLSGATISRRKVTLDAWVAWCAGISNIEI
jgi:hypothetical protein